MYSNQRTTEMAAPTKRGSPQGYYAAGKRATNWLTIRRQLFVQLNVRMEGPVLNLMFVSVRRATKGPPVTLQFVKGGVVHLQHASNLEDASARKVMLAKNAARK